MPASMRPLAALVVVLAVLPALPVSAQAPTRPSRATTSKPESPSTIKPSSPPSTAKPESSSAVKPEARAMLRALEDAFSAVADRVTPAVVNVSTVGPRVAANGDDERDREPFGDESERQFRRRPRDEGRASGSGVIVDPKGYILTNNHVIENAREIIVRLSDARKFAATLVGRDPKTDLAVLKIDAPAPLPTVELADSDRLRVGQWAIAIGNPFGLDRTVTVGIVSATARNRVGVTTYENFIQTDASINPGNSGGPLLNLDGRVIGINTAIVAAGQGIGFAIPINEARGVMAQLITRGRVVRGWLGVVIQDVTDELASSFGVRERQGVLVADVMKGGPADAGGLRPGDVVVELNRARVREVPDLQRRVAGVAPGERVRVVIVRDGARQPLTVTVGEMPADEPTALAQAGVDDFGLQVEPLSPGAAARLDLPVAQGLLVVEIAAGGPADRAGLRRGDVILEVARQPVSDAEALARTLASVGAGDGALVYVHRPGGGGRNQYLVLERGK
jgi:Do/DeqQ family serine protease